MWRGVVDGLVSEGVKGVGLWGGEDGRGVDPRAGEAAYVVGSNLDEHLLADCARAEDFEPFALDVHVVGAEIESPVDDPFVLGWVASFVGAEGGPTEYAAELGRGSSDGNVGNEGFSDVEGEGDGGG